jgi:hypothetical protein
MRKMMVRARRAVETFGKIAMPGLPQADMRRICFISVDETRSFFSTAMGVACSSTGGFTFADRHGASTRNDRSNISRSFRKIARQSCRDMAVCWHIVRRTQPSFAEIRVTKPASGALAQRKNTRQRGCHVRADISRIALTVH